MSKHGAWSVIFEDKKICKMSGEFGIKDGMNYEFEEAEHDAFWNQAKFSNLHAIQYTNDNTDNDQVEYNDGSQNGIYDESVLGSFNQFIDMFDARHLLGLQGDWDNNNLYDDDGNIIAETTEQKVARLGPRPTSYSSY